MKENIEAPVYTVPALTKALRMFEVFKLSQRDISTHDVATGLC